MQKMMNFNMMRFAKTAAQRRATLEAAFLPEEAAFLPEFEGRRLQLAGFCLGVIRPCDRPQKSLQSLVGAGPAGNAVFDGAFTVEF